MAKQHVKCNLCGKDDAKLLFNADRHGFSFPVVKCSNCGLAYINPRPDAKEVASMYDKDYFTGKGFDRSVNYQEGLAHQKERWDVYHNERLKVIERYAGKRKILDVGCAYGEFVEAAKRRGWDSYGVELSSHAASEARKRGLKVYTGTLDNVKLKKNHFNAIIMVEVIEHLTDPSKTIKQCYDLLKPGGILVVQTGNIDSLAARLAGKRWSYLLAGHLYYFSRSTLRKILVKSGFSIAKGYFGDEIPVIKKLHSFWKGNRLSIGSLMSFLFFFAAQIARKMHIGELSVGGMVFYARK